MHKNFNMARYEGQNAGPIVLIGQGAGRYPTASAVLRDLSDLACGRREMFPAGLEAVEADNEALRFRYCVRLPADRAEALPFAERETEGETLRGLTEPLSAARMHETAARLRGEGVPLFFAAMEGAL